MEEEMRASAAAAGAATGAAGAATGDASAATDSSGSASVSAHTRALCPVLLLIVFSSPGSFCVFVVVLSPLFFVSIWYILRLFLIVNGRLLLFQPRPFAFLVCSKTRRAFLAPSLLWTGLCFR